MRDDVGGHQQRVDVHAANSGALAALFCRAATKIFGLARRAATTSERFVVSLSVPATKPTAWPSPGLLEHRGLVAAAEDGVGVVLGHLARLDDRDVQPLGPQVERHLPAEPPVPAHHPVPVRGGAPRGGSGAPGPLSSQVMSW